MPNESVATSDQQASATLRLRWRRIARIAAALTMALSVLVAGTLFAICVPTVYTVTSSAPPPTGNWTDTSGAVWTPNGGFPGCAPGDTAADLNGTPTTLIINSAIPNPIIGLNLSCPGCTIDIQSGGSLALAGPGTLSSATTIIVETGGTLTIANGGSLNVQSGASLSVNGGLVDIQSGGSVTLTGASTVTNSGVLNVDGGTLTIPSGSTFIVQNTGQLEFTAGGVNGNGTVNNKGMIQMVGSGLVTVNPVVNNSSSGTVTVSSGTLSLAGGGTGDAPFVINSGGTLGFPSGSYNMTSNGSITGNGALSITGAYLTIGGVTSPGTFSFSSGTLDGPGFLSIGTSFFWDGGTMKGIGGAELAGNGMGVLSGNTGTMLLDGRTFNNYGFIGYPATTNLLHLNNNAAFNTYGTFDFQGDGSIIADGPSSVGIFPNGVMEKDQGVGTSTIQPASTNNAIVFVTSGAIEFAGNGNHSGNFITDVDGGTGTVGTLIFSAPNTGIDGQVFGAGNVSFPSGYTDYDGVFFSIGGQTSITGGTLEVDEPVSTTNFTFGSGELDLFGDFDMFGTGTWSGGTMSFDDGTFLVDSGATLTIDAANDVTQLNTAVIENYGTILYTPGQIVGLGKRHPVRSLTTSPGYLELKGGSAIFNDGLFDIQSDAQIASTISTSAPTSTSLPSPAGRARAVTGTPRGRVVTHRARTLGKHPIALCGCPNEIDNYGTLQKSAATGTTNFGPVLNNIGAMNALSGTLNFLDIYDQTAGSTTLGPGNIQDSSPLTPLTLDGGTLNGAGTITGDVTNNGGAVAPGGASTIGTINVTGNYVQTTSVGPSELDIELASPSSYDLFAVTGTTTPAGTLNVSLLSGYQPATGDTFQPLTFASNSGDFATKNLPTWASGHGTMSASYTPTALVLTAVVTPQSADLDADTLSGPATVNAGASLTYTITVGNGGPDPSTGTVTLIDTLPAGATAATGSGTNWSCNAPSGGTITCTSSMTVASGSSFPTLTFSMTAPPDPGSVSDSATVSSTESDSSPSNNTATVNTTVVGQADLSITKTGPTGVTSGQNIVYTVIVTNNGPSSATVVQVSDSTPANLTFESNSGACVTSYPCALGTLTSGQSVTITSTYSTSPSFSGNVTNMASVTATSADPNTGDNSSSAITNVGAQADLSVVKTGPASTNPGQNITYTIVVTNGGPSPATGVSVSDPTPVGVAFISNTGACTTPYPVPCSVGTLANGQSATITTTYSVPLTYSGGAIVNTATASSSVNDPNNTNDSSTATTTVGASADVGITKTGPASVSLGQSIVYTITVSDFGPANATGVVVSDPTPAGLTFVSASGGGCTVFPCTIGALAIGPPVTITATFNVPANYAGTSIINTASVTSASDPNAANNSASTTTTIASQADVSITKTGPPSVTVGSTISYTITVNNTGALAAANTFVNDSTPAGLTFLSNSGACSGPFPCSLGTINTNSPVVITSTYNVPANYAGASIVNTATVSTSSPESNTLNNTATATTPIAATGTADLSLVKTGPLQATSGGSVDFTVTVFNNGPSTATNVVISDPTPAGLTFLSNSGACSTPYPCAISAIAANNAVSVTSSYHVVLSSGSVTNTASVSSSQTDPVAGNNSSSTTVAIVPATLCPQAPVLTSPIAGATVSSPVTFSWTSVPNATGYTLSITSGGSTQSFPTTAATSSTQSLPSGAYTWSVQVLGPGACPPVTSASSSFSVCAIPGAPVPSVVAVSTTGQTYSVAWTTTDGATLYEIQESLDPSFADSTSTTLAETSKSFTKNVQNATAFFYRIRAASGCNPTAGPFSATAPVVVLPLPPLGSINPDIPLPAGSTLPVTFPIHVNGLPGLTTSYVATVDKAWLAVTPSSGIMPPEGVTFTISADPSNLQNGTWTGTVIVVFGSSGVSSKIHTQDVAPKTSIPVSISLTTPVSPGTLSAPAASAVVIPSVGHLAGFDAQWQSDIRIANITSLSKKVQLSFIGGSATSLAIKQTIITIDPNATTALDDIVRNWYGVGALGESSNGVLTVQPLDASGHPDTSISKATLASSRTFNASAIGTLGQFIPAVPLPNFISTVPGASTILALQQIAQSDTFRTNLGLVEATGKPASVLVSVFDGGGNKLLDLSQSLVGGEQRQLNSFLANNGVSLTNGHIEVQATGGDGKVTAYASVIDDRTTDPLLVSGVPIGGVGASRFVIPGVASLDTGAAWRSDVRIFNSGLTPQTTTLTLFPTGNPSASTSTSVTVQPGEVKALDDIVHSTFNLTNAGGALHVTTAVSAPLVVTARTYDDTSNGTLGQFIQAVTPADAVGNGDRSLQLLQMEDSPRYRTNLGLAEVTGKSVTAEITVILPDSKVAPKVQIPLAAFEFRQFPIISSLGLGNTYNARISVRVIDGQGKITAYGSVIDQVTQDPTFVPAQ